MDWLREWIMQIAGVIAVGAVLDIVMIDGEMKKYIKPVLGFVLIISVIGPVVRFSEKDIAIDSVQYSTIDDSGFSEQIYLKEQETVIKLYEKKLAEKMESEFKNVYNQNTQVCVTAEAKDKNFGSIKKVDVTVLLKNGDAFDAQSLKKFAHQKFDVPLQNIGINFITEEG
ncbi:MAG: stage III sporulation protein AF [Clostridia bacterium]|nr:stage III sporulation protein AF [Clostridia bacterium]